MELTYKCMVWIVSLRFYRCLDWRFCFPVGRWTLLLWLPPTSVSDLMDSWHRGLEKDPSQNDVVVLYIIKYILVVEVGWCFNVLRCSIPLSCCSFSGWQLEYLWQLIKVTNVHRYARNILTLTILIVKLNTQHLGRSTLMNFDRNTEGGWILKSPWECTGIEKITQQRRVNQRLYIM